MLFRSMITLALQGNGTPAVLAPPPPPPATVAPAAPAGPPTTSAPPASPASSTPPAAIPAGPEPEPVRPVDAGASAQNASTINETNEQWNDAVQRGLEWLAHNQNPDGSFGRGRMSANAGIVSLCALALMGDGSVPGRGRYGQAVERALGYVLQHITESGLVTNEGTNGPMYGHGFAALFLGEVYGMSNDDTRVRDALARAVRQIGRAHV